MNLIILILFTITVFNAQDSSYVELLTGKRMFGSVEYKTPLFSKNHILYNDSLEINIPKIKSVFNSDGYFRTVDNKSLVKRTTNGKRLDLYSDHVSNYINHGNGYSYSYTTFEEVYFTKKNSNLLEINYENLLTNLSDNSRSLDHLKRYKTLNYVKWGVGLLGAAILINGISKFDKENGLSDSGKSGLITGGIVMNLAWIPSLLQGTSLKDAIKEYNK